MFQYVTFFLVFILSYALLHTISQSRIYAHTLICRKHPKVFLNTYSYNIHDNYYLVYLILDYTKKSFLIGLDFSSLVNFIHCPFLISLEIINMSRMKNDGRFNEWFSNYVEALKHLNYFILLLLLY